MPILDKIKLMRIKISLEYWENVCESVESTIKDGQVACKKRWFTLENFLSFLNLPLMDLIEYGMPPKLKMEQIDRNFSKSKEKTKQLDHLHMA